MSKIVGLVGFKQVGKSTAAKYLEDKYRFVRHNFKDALVQEIKDNFPDLLNEIAVGYGFDYFNSETQTFDVTRLFEKKPPLMRALLQNYGTDVRRKDDPNYWVWKWNTAYLQSDWGDYVVDDVRFLNEAKAIKDSGGILIRLIRPDITTGGDHKSETEQLEIKTDHTIECVPGDHEALYRQLDAILGGGQQVVVDKDAPITLTTGGLSLTGDLTNS